MVTWEQEDTHVARHRNPLRRYYVIGPPYTYVDRIDAYGGPSWEERDVVEVEAHTKREAVIKGVRLMREQGMQGVSDNVSDGVPPWKGAYAELAEAEEAVR